LIRFHVESKRRLEGLRRNYLDAAEPRDVALSQQLLNVQNRVFEVGFMRSERGNLFNALQRRVRTFGLSARVVHGGPYHALLLDRDVRVVALEVFGLRSIPDLAFWALTKQVLWVETARLTIFLCYSLF